MSFLKSSSADAGTFRPEPETIMLKRSRYVTDNTIFTAVKSYYANERNPFFIWLLTWGDSDVSLYLLRMLTMRICMLISACRLPIQLLIPWPNGSTAKFDLENINSILYLIYHRHFINNESSLTLTMNNELSKHLNPLIVGHLIQICSILWNQKIT